jgi:hypothetical protein
MSVLEKLFRYHDSILKQDGRPMYRCDVGVTNSRRPPSLGAPNEKARRAKRRANNADLNFSC